MKKFIFILLSSIGLTVSAQHITMIEYSIDEFVKEGNGIIISIPETSPEIDIIPEINIAGLSEGLHTIYVRVLNTNGVWSLPVQSCFYVSNPDLTKVQKVFYRVYNDTYKGSWEQIAIEPQRKNVDSLIAISTSALDIDQSYSFEFYAVNTSGVRGYSAFLDNIVLTPTGLEDSEMSEVKFNIYPNPIKDYLNIENSSFDNQYYNLKICNLQGQVLSTVNNYKQNLTLNLSGYDNGFYILILQTDSYSIMKKILKE